MTNKTNLHILLSTLSIQRVKMMLMAKSVLKQALMSRVVSSEIYCGKFILIFPEIFRNLLITYVNQLFPSPALQSDAVK